MNYEEFVKFVQSKCMHETIYEDSEGRSILVIELIDAYGMANKLSQPTGFVDSKINPTERTWVGLTDAEIETVYAITAKDNRKPKMPPVEMMFAKTIQEYLKEKNT